MTSLIGTFDLVLAGARVLVFALGVAAAVLCGLAWLARTRRISPFSPLARFSRRTVDPILAPVERRVLRFGGNPVSAPWWALAAVVIGGIVLLSLLAFLRDQVVLTMLASRQGGRGIAMLLVRWTFGILQIALILVVLSSWIGGSRYSGWLRWAFVVTDPILRPLRRVVPTIGMIDITPLVAYFGLALLEGVLLRAI
ncbi:MAG TPA: YggT family protein [Gemmatimonadales bacterium]